MDSSEKSVLKKLSGLVTARFPEAKLILFGSRARGDAEPESDLDVLVLLEAEDIAEARRFVSECAWEAGFEHDIVVVPVVYRKQDWQNGPERYSLLATSVAKEGIPL